MSKDYCLNIFKNKLLSHVNPCCVYIKTTPKYLIIPTVNAVMEYLNNNKNIKFYTFAPSLNKTFRGAFIRNLHAHH